MTVAAIDPGTTESALVVWNGSTILRAQKSTNPVILDYLRTPMPDVMLALEMVAHYGLGMPAGREVFETCVWLGRFQQAWLTGQADAFCVFIYRRDVKLYLCNSARAKDGNVRQAIIDRLGPPGVKANKGVTYGISGDQWQALAVALTASEYFQKKVVTC